MKAALARISVSARQNYDSRRSRGPLGSPLLEGEGQGEVCDLFGESTHLSPTLSFQERKPVAQIGESRRWRGTVRILALCLAAGVAALSLPALAAEEKSAPPPASMPEPPARPTELKPEPAPTPATVPPLPDAPAPPERPAELTPPPPAAPETGPAAEMPPPPPRPADLSTPPTTSPALTLTVAPLDDTACRKRLERLGATFEALPPISNGQCGAEKPLKLTRLSGDVALTPPATLVCNTAEALARLATEAQEASERILKAPLRSLSIGTSYECRGQNHDPEAKLSEHSFANGVDIMGYGFDGRAPIKVGAGLDDAPEATFQAAIRAKACGFFRTVLGPGSDAAHGNHLHLDERERNAGHRLCQ